VFPAISSGRSDRELFAVGFWADVDEGADEDVEVGLLTQLDKRSDRAIIVVNRFIFGV